MTTSSELTTSSGMASKAQRMRIFLYPTAQYCLMLLTRYQATTVDTTKHACAVLSAFPIVRLHSLLVYSSNFSSTLSTSRLRFQLIVYVSNFSCTFPTYHVRFQLIGYVSNFSSTFPTSLYLHRSQLHALWRAPITDRDIGTMTSYLLKRGSEQWISGASASTMETLG